jgi:PAS domain S-box-containing protein
MGALAPLRWSALGLRTKGLIVVGLPLMPLSFLWLVMGVALLRDGPPRNPDNPRARSVALVFLGGSIACGAAGVSAALLLAAGLRRRIDVLTRNADRLAHGDDPEPLPPGQDEIAQLGERLACAGLLLREREAALGRTNRTLDDFFNLSHDLFALAGFDGRFKRLNPAWERTLRYSMAELMAKPFLDFVHPDDREATRQASAKLLTGEDVVSFENRYQCQDGSYRWLRWNSRSLVDAQIVYASAHDITEEREAMGQLDELNRTLRLRSDQLQAANQELEAFSYSVSHDLRAPLRAIDGFTRVIEEDCADRLDPAGRDALRRVRAAAARMSELIDALLGLARLTRTDMRPERVDVSAMASSILAELCRRDPHRRAQVSVATGLAAEADARLLGVALENLLGNAWKYTVRTECARIEVGATRSAESDVFFVRDNGAGFDMAYADKLFGAFQRLHADPEFQGTGIGLATVHSVVRRHGGRIWAESWPNAGATFYFTLGTGGAE